MLRARLLVARNDAEVYEAALHDALGEFKRVNQELENVYASQRWKITEPLSKLKQAFKRNKTVHPVVSAPGSRPYAFPKDKKVILLIDRYIPRADSDAGSSAMLGYAGLLADMGYAVLFMGEDFEPPQDADGLREAGIVPLHGEYYRRNWRDFIADNEDRFSAVIISRPNVARRFMPFIKQHTNIRVLYFGQDLHFLRQSRAQGVDASAGGDVEIARAMELTAMSDADVVVMYSGEECALINKEFGINAVSVPLFFYRSIPERETPFDETQDLFFVGSFTHAPNVDALKWFLAYVFPLIREGAPGVKFIAAGSDPGYEVRALAEDDVVIAGDISADQLLEYYAKSRVCVIPLRYGAGVKGKTVEAMYNGLPLVSTSIGIEGMPGIEQVIKPCDAPGRFAEEVIRLYNSEPDWSAMRAAYPSYLKKYYSYDAAKNTMEKLLNG